MNNNIEQKNDNVNDYNVSNNNQHVITQHFDIKKNIDTAKILDEVYSYQSKSTKFDKIPFWTKVLISCIFIILAIGSIVGGVFSIMALNEKISSTNQEKIITSIIIDNK